MENLLSLINFTKLKKKLLSQMMTLDIENKTNTDSYIELLNNYKLVCGVYDRKLRTLTENEKIELVSKINLLNSKALTILPLEKLLEQNNNYDVLTRVILDLSNHSLIDFYQDKKSVTDFASKFLNYLGLEQPKNKMSNTEMINEYMNQDFINLLFSNIINYAQKETVFEFRQLLFYWKYQLVLLSSSLETRNLMTNFSIPTTVKLIDQTTIETTGITVEKYMKEFDSIISDYMYNILKTTLFSNASKCFYLDLIFFETLSNLLNNNEYIEIIQMELEDYINSNLPLQKQEKLKELLEILKENQDNRFNNKENRKYIKI